MYVRNIMQLWQFLLDLNGLVALRSEFNEFVPRPLLWATLKQLLRPQEVDEVKRILGSLAVERNEELNCEVLALLDILGDFRAQSAELAVCHMHV